MQFTKVHQKLAKPVYEAIPKIAERAGKEWEWEPTIGDKICRGTMILFYAGIIRAIDGKRAGKFISDAGTEYEWPIDVVIPLLHWERIERIVNDLGYILSVDEAPHGETPDYRFAEHFVWIIKRSKVMARGSGKDRQEAVQKAMLSLVEKLEEKQ